METGSGRWSWLRRTALGRQLSAPTDGRWSLCSPPPASPLSLPRPAGTSRRLPRARSPGRRGAPARAAVGAHKGPAGELASGSIATFRSRQVSLRPGRCFSGSPAPGAPPPGSRVTGASGGASPRPHAAPGLRTQRGLRPPVETPQQLGPGSSPRPQLSCLLVYVGKSRRTSRWVFVLSPSFQLSFHIAKIF